MRFVLSAAISVGLLACMAISGPAVAAVSVKAEAPPERLGQCAIALNRFKAINKSHGEAVPPEIIERLEAIMAFSKTRTGDWSQTFSAALRAQIAKYDAMSSGDMVEAVSNDVYACEAFLNADTQMNPPN